MQMAANLCIYEAFSGPPRTNATIMNVREGHTMGTKSHSKGGSAGEIP